MRAIALLLLPGCGMLFGPADPALDQKQRFTVPKGSTALALASQLEEEGIIEDAWRWKLFIRLEGGDCLKAGEFWLQPSMSIPRIKEVLCGPPIPPDIPFTVVEGWRIRDIDEALAAAGLAAPGAYARAVANLKAYKVDFPLEATSLEGYLYPDTYMVLPDEFQAAVLVQRQLDSFDAHFWSAHKDDLGSRTLNDVVILASLLEREEPDPAWRPTTAGVLWKRLDKGWNLGVDATSRYTLPDWNDRDAFLVRLRDPKDVYNTRLRGGLPPTAIGNPGITALEAAIGPVESEYWYYLHDGSRKVHYGRNAAEHEANRRRYNVY